MRRNWRMETQCKFISQAALEILLRNEDGELDNGNPVQVHKLLDSSQEFHLPI
jgi:hypothetical protein